MCPFDEPVRKSKLAPQTGFDRTHFASVGLVIVAGQMEQSVQDQNLQLCLGRVAELSSPHGSNLCRDRNIARGLA